MAPDPKSRAQPDTAKLNAAASGLRYSQDSEPGISRRKCGKGFTYRHPDGTRVKDNETLQRIRKLAVPPAYTDVWICRTAEGHLQATGRDARGRKQYRYHPRFREIQDANKYDRMLDFAEALPKLRRRIRADMNLRGMPRKRVLATVVHLLETTMIRIGSAEYARQNNSYGLTTLKDQHVRINGSEMRFHFKGKSGKVWRLSVKDRRVAKIVRQCQELPGQALFQYLDEDGQRCEVTSGDVNDYLRDMSGSDITAKDFRTWTGTVLAALSLCEIGLCENEAEARRNLKEAMSIVAERLGNTPAICRKCYVHPHIVESYLSRSLVLREPQLSSKDVEHFQPQEAAVLSFLLRRAQYPSGAE